jgi:hypothetical protein
MKDLIHVVPQTRGQSQRCIGKMDRYKCHCCSAWLNASGMTMKVRPHSRHGLPFWSVANGRVCNNQLHLSCFGIRRRYGGALCWMPRPSCLMWLLVMRLKCCHTVRSRPMVSPSCDRGTAQSVNQKLTT